MGPDNLWLAGNCFLSFFFIFSDQAWEVFTVFLLNPNSFSWWYRKGAIISPYGFLNGANFSWNQFLGVRIQHNGWWRIFNTLSLGLNPSNFLRSWKVTLHTLFNRVPTPLATSFYWLKTGGSRRSVIIPGGQAKHGWRIFRLKLRKMLEPNQYVVGGSGHSKFTAQPNSEIQTSDH